MYDSNCMFIMHFFVLHTRAHILYNHAMFISYTVILVLYMYVSHLCIHAVSQNAVPAKGETLKNVGSAKLFECSGSF